VVKLVDGDAQQVTLRDGGCVVECGRWWIIAVVSAVLAANEKPARDTAYLRVEGRAQLAGE
jgi:hypothetical protein